MKPVPLTQQQSDLIADNLPTLRRMIASKLSSAPRRLITDLIDDAIFRLCIAVSSQSITTLPDLRRRACLCALDAIRSAATRDQHAAQHLATLTTITVRLNCEALAG